MIETRVRWPAEWEPHAATWLAWPHNTETWPDLLAEVQAEFAEFASLLADSEPVRILAGGAAMPAAERRLGTVPNVTLVDVPTNDAWCRDYGPIFRIADSEPPVLDARYNAWGEKYPPYDHDNAVPAEVARRLGCPVASADYVLEGGAIEGNGAGVAMTTTSCLPHRNGLAPTQLEPRLRRDLGIENVLWLPAGELAGDDTDGHIDQLARFINPDTVVAPLADPNLPGNDRTLSANGAFLKARAASGTGFNNLIALPMPTPVMEADRPLPASYCNFYIANRQVLVPQFGVPQDDLAVEILRDCFADREVTGSPARHIIRGLGAFHCLTQPQPTASIPGES